MKRQDLFFVVAMSLLLLGCQDQLALRDDANPDRLATKAGVDANTVQTNERYVFLSEKDFMAWTDIIGLENRLAACDIPAGTLKAMTTDALVRTALNYPLNFIYSAYNDPFVAVDIIVKNSPLHQELFSRNDAVEVMLRYFDRTSIFKSEVKTMFNRDEISLTVSNEVFFEYLLASCQDSGLFSKKNNQALRKIAQRKLSEREADPDIFCSLTATPLQMIVGETAEQHPVRTPSSWNWHTPFGESVMATENDEMPEYERDLLTYEYMTSYPNATVHGMASNLYNGNGYAWIIRDPTVSIYDLPALYTKSWVVGLYPVSHFWSDNLYDSCSASDAERIYYSTADHSAIPDPSSSTMFLSKWGNGPLMEHAPADCPYSTTILNYYKMRTTPYTGFAIAGPSSVTVNTNNTYTWQNLKHFYRLSLSVSAENYSSLGPSPVIVSSSDYSCTISCPAAGAYKVTFEARFGSLVVARSVKDIICSPN